ncbi:bifunctional demethylmenaquinone methyltransferase/2-methoxy-6-polyprenyl-1,4-benzoquinol methylase UbiE [Campylobacter concisus]|jgi:ubiquinone/menaquinone biosynthesis methyltransferase ubiE|uniref:Demethylmenaquinone methyltransferase n=1 Tax=Campylobacter concisus TaxID=199 RepID=A0A1Y5NBV1_9BACT|nr:bifunctional demethylmenaquinone methyltransferase/2-methoxy-6-polyprenyl-1,4-benzoquinol methylase UbiE [Campylobacter concisus]OUT18358.1 bifunctional demethylmenaquinone methyltransferase/2-methoxy-6-polyprenyl-1,4-benzoquinol methylase [Campylobacter concisus]QPH88455.1 bifunctional demethylmenaquinone methyltransferase/2-methoxy-6-polyprenyl-1,4-benzoquinol methylase UbiE [Campylobacter concisus]QPI03403.1 bifunctional demethylmenaquinone methyltransferase/2-methoxy-6-polyprenyl-1,4-benz
MQKQEKIVDMFNQIAPTYDVANRVLSLGVDVSWRKFACRYMLEIFKERSINIVDVACGTGDMMGLWSEISKEFGVQIKSLTGIDPSSGMLKEARAKFPNFKFIEAYADNTTLASGEAQILSISYGIRNVVERKAALREFNRVLALNGYVVVLEFTKRQKKGLITSLRDFYLSKILPKIGGFISKNKEAYEYLPSSIENFLDAKSFCDELVEAGFEIELCKGFSMDISTLFIAKKVREINA